MSPSNRSSTGPTIIIAALFFIFGFVTWLNGTLILYLKIACELNDFQAYLVTFAFYIAYLVTALPASRILEKTGFKKGMILGLLVMALGALVFIPAAYTRTYALFLGGLFVIGTGLSILQTASNPYITVLGPIESAASRISIMGICNKVAGVIAPLILGALILSQPDTLMQEIASLDPLARAARLDALALKVIWPYVGIMGVLIALSLWIYFAPLPDIEQEEETEQEKSAVEKTSIFQYPQLVLGVIALFLYVGAEVIAGDTIGIYGQSQQIPLSEARNFTSMTLSAMVVGYIIGIFTIPRYIRQEKALEYSAYTGLLFSIGILCTSGYTSVLFVALLGLANALVWPAIWPLAISGLGKFTKRGSALLIMAIAGGATLPPLYGALSDQEAIGHQWAYTILIPCYLFILYYAVKGHKVKPAGA